MPEEGLALTDKDLLAKISGEDFADALKKEEELDPGSDSSETEEFDASSEEKTDKEDKAESTDEKVTKSDDSSKDDDGTPSEDESDKTELQRNFEQYGLGSDPTLRGADDLPRGYAELRGYNTRLEQDRAEQKRQIDGIRAELQALKNSPGAIDPETFSQDFQENPEKALEKYGYVKRSDVDTGLGNLQRQFNTMQETQQISELATFKESKKDFNTHQTAIMNFASEMPEIERLYGTKRALNMFYRMAKADSIGEALKSNNSNAQRVDADKKARAKTAPTKKSERTELTPEQLSKMSADDLAKIIPVDPSSY